MRRFSLRSLLIFTAIVAVSLSVPPWLHRHCVGQYEVYAFDPGDDDLVELNADNQRRMEEEFTPGMMLICLGGLCGAWYAAANRPRRCDMAIGVSFALPLAIIVQPVVFSIPAAAGASLASLPLRSYEVGASNQQLLTVLVCLPTSLAYSIWPYLFQRKRTFWLLLLFVLYCCQFSVNYIGRLFEYFGD